MVAPGDNLQTEIAALAAALRVALPDPEHAERCARFAASLFDALAGPLQLGPHDRRLAVAAALLHDIGYARGGRDHHRKSYDVIMETDLPGVVAEERVIVACAARYHGHTLPNIEHAGFGELGYVDQRRVRRLAALVRLASALDASHLGLVQEVRAGGDMTHAWLHATASDEPAVERDRLREAAGGFEALAGIPLRVEIETTRYRVQES